ncbi:unnamed protein product [Ascophyllum nodosum]
MLPALSLPDELPSPEELQEARFANDHARPSSAALRPSSPILKYEDPVLARPHEVFDLGMGHDSLPQYISLCKTTNGRKEEFGGAVRTRRRSPKDDNMTLLKAIIPNREWTDEDGEWVQTVSSAEWTRADLEALKRKVDATLATCQARPRAICAVREQIFSELFDEIIREVTIECPERGLLLLRLRDEARMNLETYTEIYRDSVVFSNRKAEDTRAELDKFQRLLAKLEGQASDLQARARSLDAELKVINRSNAFSRTTINLERTEHLQLARAEKKALEEAISKTQKKLKEASATIAPTIVISAT